MKIAAIVNSFPPRLGGLEQHVDNLMRELSEAGHDVDVITLNDAVSIRFEGGMKIMTGLRRFPVADIISFPRLGTTAKLERYLRRNKVEVVSIHTRFFPMSFVGMRAAKRAHIPVIHTEHGSGPVAGGSIVTRVGSRIVDSTLGRWVVRSADQVLGVSEEAADFAVRLGAQSAEVFPNAIPSPIGTGLIKHDASHLVFVGRVVPGKGWDTYLKVVAQLRDRGRCVTGVLLGDGPDLPSALLLVEQLDLNSVVEVRGRVSPASVRAELSGATLVNPTVLSEGFQTTLLEAVAEGGGVVTFPVPGAARLASEGMPVTIVAEKSVKALVEAVEFRLDEPLPAGDPSLIEPWTWPARAKQYEKIMVRVVERYRCSRK